MSDEGNKNAYVKKKTFVQRAIPSSPLRLYDPQLSGTGLRKKSKVNTCFILQKFNEAFGVEIAARI